MSALKSKLLELIVLCTVTLLFPAVIGRTVLRKDSFDAAPVAAMKARPPAYVFIGDSMAGSRIDMKLFEELSGETVGDLVRNGSASARWYLHFKNYVVDAGIRPKMTFIFFRDSILSDPLHRTQGKYREELEEAMKEREPVVEALTSREALARRDAGNWLLQKLYPVQERQTAVREVIEQRLLRIASFSMSRDDLKGSLGDTFELGDLRAGGPTDLATEEIKEIEKFDPAPTASFLPHILELSRKHQLPVCFVRVKRVQPDDEEWLDSYINDLRTWLTQNGALYYDESGDDAITREMYGNGDHIAEQYKPFVTRRFFEAVKDRLK
jgi:hypothetical protein